MSKPVPVWNAFDKLVEAISPELGNRRRAFRHANALYEANRGDRLRKDRNRISPPNTTTARHAVSLRNQVRILQMNDDVFRGILRTLVNNTIGPEGIGVEPTPRNKNGEIHEEAAQILQTAFRRWALRPEVTGSRTFSQEQRLIGSSFYRDGEVFTQMLMGNVRGLQFDTDVPFALEAVDADMCPMDLDDPDRRIRSGVQVNAWGRITGFHVYKEHPDDSQAGFRSTRNQETKRIPAERMLHLRAIDRISQLRGVTEMASIITRLADIHDYEESERIAAKVAASLTAYIKKGDATGYGEFTAGQGASQELDADDIGANRRELEMSPGMIIDDLLRGEEIGMVDSKRPNPNVVTFRQGQLRAAAAGVGTSYSTIARSYDGTFSAQRQELVESYMNYAVMADSFVGMYVRPVYSNFARIAVQSRAIQLPGDVDPLSIDDALYTAQEMPWIDPLKEAAGFTALIRAGLGSEVEMIRKRGLNPDQVLDQIRAWRRKVKGSDEPLIFDSDAANTLSIDSNANEDTDERVPAGA